MLKAKILVRQAGIYTSALFSKMKQLDAGLARLKIDDRKVSTVLHNFAQNLTTENVPVKADGLLDVRNGDGGVV